MNTITHEGMPYEVLTLDRISEITHAKLAGGMVVRVDDSSEGTDIWLKSPTIEHADLTCFDLTELEPYGIIPLRLVPKEPVTFEGVVVKEDLGVRDDWVIFAPEEYIGKRFRCVEIVEEA